MLKRLFGERLSRSRAPEYPSTVKRANDLFRKHQATPAQREAFWDLVHDWSVQAQEYLKRRSLAETPENIRFAFAELQAPKLEELFESVLSETRTR